MTDHQSTMEEIKCIVRSIAISGSTRSLTARDLARDFKNIEGYDLPYARLGFSSVDKFLMTLKDTVRVSGFGPTATVEPVVAQSNKHIREMVQASKPSRNRNANKKPNMNSNYRPKTYYANNQYGQYGKSNGNYSANNNGNSNYRDTEPRKVFNSEYDFRDEDQIDEEDSGSSDDQPKFTMNGSSKLEQVTEQEPSPSDQQRSLGVEPANRDAIPDSAALEFVNSLEVPPDAMNMGDKIVSAKIPESINPKDSIRVFVTEVHNPNRFWYHIGDSVAKVDEMMNEIEFYYAHLSREEWRLKPGNATVGFYCMAKYHGQWHRAQIVSEYDHNKLKVFYIDYGTVALLDLKDLKYMAKCFADVPAQAMRASMAYVKPVSHRWTRDASWSLLSLVYEKLLYAYVVDVDRVDNVLHVVLIDTSGAQDCIINQQLFVKGHAVWEDDLPYKEKSTENFRNRPKLFNELYPRFDDLENGNFPSLQELAEFRNLGFNFGQYYSQALLGCSQYFQNARTRTLKVKSHSLVDESLVAQQPAAQLSTEDDYLFDDEDVFDVAEYELLAYEEESTTEKSPPQSCAAATDPPVLDGKKQKRVRFSDLDSVSTFSDFDGVNAPLLNPRTVGID